MVIRQNQVDQINERNKRIAEIQGDLQKSIDIFVPKKNYIEDAENMLKVEASEIPFDRYLSKEERAKLESLRLKEEQRLLELA